LISEVERMATAGSRAPAQYARANQRALAVYMAREVIRPSLLPTTSPSQPSAAAPSINAIEFTEKMTAAFGPGLGGGI